MTQLRSARGRDGRRAAVRRVPTASGDRRTRAGKFESRRELSASDTVMPERLASHPESMSRYFRVLGDPTRLRIIHALLERERMVSELVELVEAPRSRISNHLACLKWCRVADSERRGRNVIYRIADARVRELLGAARELAAEHCDHLASCRRIGPDWI